VMGMPQDLFEIRFMLIGSYPTQEENSATHVRSSSRKDLVYLAHVVTQAIYRGRQQ
jgi:hypothetical protein